MVMADQQFANGKRPCMYLVKFSQQRMRQDGLRQDRPSRLDGQCCPSFAMLRHSFGNCFHAI
eukprot:scaffold344192_cov37-Prasinocladus_malaysianus.AAC.1